MRSRKTPLCSSNLPCGDIHSQVKASMLAYRGLLRPVLLSVTSKFVELVPDGIVALSNAARTSLPLSLALLCIFNFLLYWNFYNSLTLIWLRDFVHDMRHKLIHHWFYLWIDLSFTSSRKSHSWNGLISGWRETFTHGCTVLHEYWQVREFFSLCGWFSSILIIEFRFQSAARPFLSKI